MAGAFARRYRERGCSYTWLVFDSEFSDTFRGMERDGLHVEVVPQECTSGLGLVMFLLKFIIEKKVDVLHMHFIKPLNAVLLMILSKLLLRRTIFVYYKRSPGRIISAAYNLKRYVNPLSIMGLFVNKIVCNSDAIVDNCINRGVSRKKVVRIYNGIDVNRFSTVRASGAIRKEFNIPGDHRIVTVIKDARPETGIDALLCSVPGVITVHPGTTFLIVGGGAETGRLKDLSLRLGIEKSVVFAGVRNDIPDIIAESYITVDPSPVEAFGNVIVESMAGGKPVVAVKAWGPKEIILDGVTGLLVEPATPRDFATPIKRLLSSPEETEEMGRKAFERARACFSAEKMIAHTVDLTMELLRSRA